MIERKDMEIRNILVKTAAAVMFTASGLIYAFMPGDDAGLREFSLDSRMDNSGIYATEEAGNTMNGRTENEDSVRDGGTGDADMVREACDTKIDINSADAGTLDMLPGIGPAKAEAILAYREEYGPFEKPEDLMNVPGIKDGIYNKLKDLICCR